MTKYKGGYIRRNDGSYLDISELTNNDLEELGMRQLFDEESKSFSYLIWDKKTEDAVIIDPVRDQVSRDIIVSTNLHLIFAINTHVYEDRISGTSSLKKKIKGLRSVISSASGADADEHIGDRDEIHFGNRHIVALATPGRGAGSMCFLLDDGKAVLTGDTLHGQGLVDSGSAWSLYDSLFHILFKLPDDCVVLPGHDFGGGLHSTVGRERDAWIAGCGITMEEFVDYVRLDADKNSPPLPKDTNIIFACNMKDGAKPFNLRSLRTHVKQGWGIFG